MTFTFTISYQVGFYALLAIGGLLWGLLIFEKSKKGGGPVGANFLGFVIVGFLPAAVLILFGGVMAAFYFFTNGAG